MLIDKRSILKEAQAKAAAKNVPAAGGNNRMATKKTSAKAEKAAETVVKAAKEKAAEAVVAAEEIKAALTPFIDENIARIRGRRKRREEYIATIGEGSKPYFMISTGNTGTCWAILSQYIVLSLSDRKENTLAWYVGSLFLPSYSYFGRLLMISHIFS